MAVIVVSLTGCVQEKRNISSPYQTDTEKIEGLVNFSLIDSTELQKHMDKKMRPDEAVVLEMMLDYNMLNDDTKFSNNNGKEISNEDLKKRMLLLSNNLR
jgi:uncharacterized protein YktB (UPF0637 family)